MCLLGVLSPPIVADVPARVSRGRWAGLVLTAGSAGGIAGALATGLWLLPALGIARAYLAVAATLAAVAVLANRRTRSLAEDAIVFQTYSRLVLSLVLAAGWASTGKADDIGVAHFQPEPIRIKLSDLPEPFHTQGASNSPQVVPPPSRPRLELPDGFRVKLFAEVPNARWLRLTPGGDVLCAASRDNKIVFIPFDDQGRPRGYYEDFVRGFLLEPEVPKTWGRPVGVLVLPDGSLLFTEEGNGRIYRVWFAG